MPTWLVQCVDTSEDTAHGQEQHAKLTGLGCGPQHKPQAGAGPCPEWVGSRPTLNALSFVLCPNQPPQKHQNAGAQSTSACHRACGPALRHSWGMTSTHIQSLSGSSHKVKCCHTHMHGRASARVAFRQKNAPVPPPPHAYAHYLMLQTRQAAEAAVTDAPTGHTAMNCTPTSATSVAHAQRERGLYAGLAGRSNLKTRHNVALTQPHTTGLRRVRVE